ncbi:hypothetical protein F5Y10DRAFT_253430 [Nemania abortiva]|nr:hypothetical protein F5Y10DRAFT_253430 [Nemania abortiva]
MTTKPSAAPWADEPFPLIETPSVKIKSDHFYLKAASEMTHAHNVILRSLNAILQQGPHVRDSTDPHYRARDVADFLHYVRCWVEMVGHHHDVEEKHMFPQMREFSGRPDLMEEPQHQHESFHAGLETLGSYSKDTRPDRYRWAGSGGMKQIIDSFSKDLTDHLYAEIGFFLKTDDLDSDEYEKAWSRFTEVAAKSGGLTMILNVVPIVLGSADKTYEGGHEDFPPFPWVMPYLANYVLATLNGAWRFNPCDLWGKPRPLAFVGGRTED